MADDLSTVLVPVRVLEGEAISEAVGDLLAGVRVVVLGYHVLPEQTPPGQARMQFKEQARSALSDLAAAFAEAGTAVETRLVFTHDREQTFDRVATEEDCTAYLIPNPTRAVRRVLVPIRGEVNVARVAGFVADLVADTRIEVTLYHVAADESGEGRGRAMLDEAAAVLEDGGVDPGAVSREVVVTDAPLASIVAAAAEHDAVVMGESEPSLRTLVFGEAAEQVADRSLGPVIVVRRVHENPGPES